MTAPVPFLDLDVQAAAVMDEVRAGFDRVMSTTAFVNGPDVRAFEDAFAAYTGTAHCVGVANGTDAIELALRALGVSEGAEVVIPANTFVATAEAIVRAGATPVLADVDPQTLLVDVAAMEAAITSRTEALVPVHLYGQMAPMREVQTIAARHGLAVVEDAAQAQGARQDDRGVGAGSAAAATSFYPGKNLGAFGDGGAVLTDSEDLATTVRMIGDHGSRRKYVHEVFGFNSRLDTLQAVVLNAKLRHLERWNEGRRSAAAVYLELLSDVNVQPLSVLPGNLPVWHLFPVLVDADRRDDLIRALQGQGIGCGIHYPTPVHLHPAFADLGLRAGAFPVAEWACSSTLSLPMFPSMTTDQVERVVTSLTEALVDVPVAS